MPRRAGYPAVGLFDQRYLDGMRHLPDLHRGEADAAIRVGDGCWLAAVSVKSVDSRLGIRFSETVMMPEAAKAARDVAIALMSLV